MSRLAQNIARAAAATRPLPLGLCWLIWIGASAMLWHLIFATF